MPGLLTVGGSYKGDAMKGMKWTSELEQKREQTDQIRKEEAKAAHRQERASAIGTGAAVGAMAGAKAGSSGGPLGIVIGGVVGGVVGWLGSELF